MSWEDNIKKSDYPSVGQTVSYRILGIDKAKQKISCGIKQLSKHPYEILRDEISQGTILETVISNITDFGVFVDFEFDGKKYTGLLPNAEIDLEVKQTLQKESKLKVCLVKITPFDKRITFSLKRMQKAIEKAEIDKYISKDDNPIEESLGNLVNKKDEKI